MSVLEQTYECLLADVSKLTGFSEIRGSGVGLQWILSEGPKLEKLMLASIETDSDIDLDQWPAWLHNLARCSKWNAYCLRLLRQLLLFGYKASVPHDKQTTDQTFDNFIKCNSQVKEKSNSFSKESSICLDLARRHCQSVLYRFQARGITPKHGPGAVTTSKEKWTAIFDSIEYCYPYSDYFSLSLNSDQLSYWESADRPSHIKAKLIAVPKDSRGPRLICVHPAEAIWIQQGLRLELERVIALTRSCYGPWPRGRVRFNDQSANGSIALTSSLSRHYATIDMKEASDRIPDVLVQVLFGTKYKFFGCCRAQKYVIPNHKGKPYEDDLHCYAPMGNATTFPVQSIVFWSICVAALQRLGFHQPGAVFVFGDDIIIPTVAAEYVIDMLESFGMLVNRTKSFYRGAFRESCGVDAFNGVNVTPVRWKTTVNAEGVLGLQSLSDIAMRLRLAGYEEAAVYAYSHISRTLRLDYGRQLFLTNNVDHGSIAEYSERDASVWRDAYWHRDYQRYVSPVDKLELRTRKRSHSDWNHVLESVVGLHHHGTYTVPNRDVPLRLRLTKGWTDIS